MKEYIIKAPFFTGFYGSELFNKLDDLTAFPETHPELYNELTERKLINEFSDAIYDLVDWKKTHENISEQLVDQIYQDKFGDYIEKVEFDSLWSPTYYNYSTDEIYMRIILTSTQQTNIELYCFEEVGSNFEKYLQRYYTSSDGYISFIPNNIGEFKEEYQRLKHMEDDEITTYLEIFFEFLFSIENNQEKVSPDDSESMWEALTYSSDFDEKEIAEKLLKENMYEYAN